MFEVGQRVSVVSAGPYRNIVVGSTGVVVGVLSSTSKVGYEVKLDNDTRASAKYGPVFFEDEIVPIASNHLKVGDQVIVNTPFEDRFHNKHGVVIAVDTFTSMRRFAVAWIKSGCLIKGDWFDEHELRTVDDA